jgi:hypothetical protein
MLSRRGLMAAAGLWPLAPLLPSAARAQGAPASLKVGLLPFGTVSWEAAVIKAEGSMGAPPSCPARRRSCLPPVFTPPEVGGAGGGVHGRAARCAAIASGARTSSLSFGMRHGLRPGPPPDE